MLLFILLRLLKLKYNSFKNISLENVRNVK